MTVKELKDILNKFQENVDIMIETDDLYNINKDEIRLEDFSEDDNKELRLVIGAGL